MEPDPGVERQAVVARPRRVALDRRQRIALLVGRPDAGDDRGQAVGPGVRAHRLEDDPAVAVALAVGPDRDLQRAEGAGRLARLERRDAPQELVVPARGQVLVGAVPGQRARCWRRRPPPRLRRAARAGTARSPSARWCQFPFATGKLSMNSGHTDALTAPTGPHRSGRSETACSVWPGGSASPCAARRSPALIASALDDDRAADQVHPAAAALVDEHPQPADRQAEDDRVDAVADEPQDRVQPVDLAAVRCRARRGCRRSTCPASARRAARSTGSTRRRAGSRSRSGPSPRGRSRRRRRAGSARKTRIPTPMLMMIVSMM